jgi:hypothetical protein
MKNNSKTTHRRLRGCGSLKELPSQRGLRAKGKLELCLNSRNYASGINTKVPWHKKSVK